MSVNDPGDAEQDAVADVILLADRLVKVRQFISIGACARDS